MKITNKTDRISIWNKIKKLFVSDVKTTIIEVDSRGNVLRTYKGADCVIMDEDWCVPVTNMKYNGLTLFFDEDVTEARFKKEQIESWTLSNNDRIVIGPFERETCNLEYLKPSKMKNLFSELCEVGVYDLNVLTKTGHFRIKIEVIDSW